MLGQLSFITLGSASFPWVLCVLFYFEKEDLTVRVHGGLGGRLVQLVF